MNMEIEKTTHDLEIELLLDFAQIELDGSTLTLKQELDNLPLERLDNLINAFKKVGTRPDEVLFLQCLIALKMAKKNLEVNHIFNRKISPLAGPTVEQQPQ
jgi:hypothetical protein